MTETYNANPSWVRRSSMEINDRHHHYIVLSYLHDWMSSIAVANARGSLLDYGSGGQPYRKMLEQEVTNYVTADVADYAGVSPDIKLQPDSQVEWSGELFDTILATQTLEHVQDPTFYLSECHRLMKEGGTLILTAPMQWRHHEVPYDYFRYTRYGLEHLLKKNGFEVVRIDSAGGVFAMIGQTLVNFLNERKIYRPLVYKIINRTSLWLDRKYPDQEDVLNWMCIARKTRTQ